MEFIMQTLLPCLYAGAACVAFTFVFNIHGWGKLICGAGGALGWLVYLLCGQSIPAAFLAAVSISLFSEVMARVRRCPVTGYLLVALLPLVPGGGIYYAMRSGFRFPPHPTSSRMLVEGEPMNLAVKMLAGRL